jgi:hypothetical protein
VEAASWQGRPVYFSITGDWQEPEPLAPAIVILFVLAVVTFAAVGAVAWNNLRLGRCDRRGATRIAAFTFLLAICEWGFEAEHVVSQWELHLAVAALSLAAFWAGLLWALYIAIEPYVRRHWPDSLISWTRLQAGRLRDPLVASHVLAGVATAGLLFVFLYGIQLVGGRLWGPWALFLPGLQPLDSGASFVSQMFFQALGATVQVIGFLFFLVLLRLLIRRMTIADIAGSILFGATAFNATSSVPENIVRVATSALSYYGLVWVLRRFGLLAVWTCMLAVTLVVAVPLILPSWYAGRAIVAVAIPSAMAAWALWVVLSAKRGTESAAA